MERKKRITKEQKRQLEILKDMLVNGSNEEKAAIANLLEKREKQAKLDELLKKRDELNKLIDELES
jgi:hypothetical protein